VLRRLLRRKRDAPAGNGRAELDGQYSVCILPWLALDSAVSFADVRLDRWSRIRGTLPPDVATTAADILNGFRLSTGRALDPSLCWFVDRSPTAALSEEDAEQLRERIFLLALAGIATNRYLSHHRQTNATHFARIYQRFTPDTESIALVRRRRDGVIRMGGVQLDEMTVTAPIAAEERPSVEFDRPLLDALATCLDADDDVSTLIRQSLPIFVQGSELDEHGSHGQDVVWIASAVEQICDISGRNKSAKMAVKVIATLGADWSDHDKRQLRRWMEEFYAKRSEIHGGEANRERWPYWAHALLGTVLYVTFVKYILADARRYELTDCDRNDAAGFPHRIRCLIDADTKPQEQFAECWHESQMEGAFRRILRRLGI